MLVFTFSVSTYAYLLGDLVISQTVRAKVVVANNDKVVLGFSNHITRAGGMLLYAVDTTCGFLGAGLWWVLLDVHVEGQFSLLEHYYELIGHGTHWYVF